MGKFAHNGDCVAELLATGDKEITRPNDMDSFWALWNCYVMKRVREDLKPEDKKDKKALEQIMQKFDLQASIFKGYKSQDDETYPDDFEEMWPLEPYGQWEKKTGA